MGNLLWRGRKYFLNNGIGMLNRAESQGTYVYATHGPLGTGRDKRAVKAERAAKRAKRGW